MIIIILLSLSLGNVISKPLIFDQNYSNNNDAKLFVSVYGLGICTVNIDDNQEIDQDLILIYNSSSDIKSIEYNNNEKSIVWLEDGLIKKAHFDLKYDTQIENQKITVIIDKGVTAFGLDWTHNLLYYHVSEDKDIKVIDMSDPNKHKVIISPTKEIVGDIKVDPISAKIVWSQWDIEENKAQIMTANEDGTNQTDIAAMAQFKNIISLAIDYSKGKIYFIDKKLFILGSIDYRGNYKIMIESQRDLFKFSRSIDVFRNNVYWNFLKSVYSIPTYGNQNYLRKILINEQFIDAVEVIDSSKQRFAPNRCLNNICSYLCLPSGQNHYSCVCPQNMTTKSLCVESTNEITNFDTRQIPTVAEFDEKIANYEKFVKTLTTIIIILFITFIIPGFGFLIYYCLSIIYANFYSDSKQNSEYTQIRDQTLVIYDEN